jgi:hypothetical protein
MKAPFFRGRTGLFQQSLFGNYETEELAGPLNLQSLAGGEGYTLYIYTQLQ